MSRKESSDPQVLQTISRIAKRQGARLGLSWEERDDLGQTVVLQFLDAKNPVEHVRAWAGVVAHRQALHLIRKRFDLALPNESGRPSYVEERLDLLNALSRIGAEERSAWWQRAVLERTIAEVKTARTGSVSTIKRRYRKAENRMRRMLAAYN